jgi:TonB family protein
MAPLTKDSVEVANPAGDVEVSQPVNQTKSAPGLRSDAVSLEVPVKVHGSRVVAIASGSTPQTEPFEEQTATMIVFPQGAVLRMSSPVNVSQMLVLTNLKTKQDSICRVLKVRPNANLGSYVEVEFTHRQPGYWGISFASDPAPVNTVAPPPINLESQPKQSYSPPPAPPAAVTPASRPSVTPAAPREAHPASVAAPVQKAVPPTAPFTPAQQPESTFISIGSQESVQEAASSTATTRALSPVERRIENPAPFPPKSVPAIEPAPADLPSLSLTDLPGDGDPGSSSVATTTAEPLGVSPSRSAEAHEAAAASTPAQPAREIFGNFAAAAGNASPSTQSEIFGARLDGGLGTSAIKDANANQNWILIAACIGVLIAGLGAGIFYFRQHSANSSGSNVHASANMAQPAPNNSDQLPAITPPGQPYMAGSTDGKLPARSNILSAPPATTASPVAAAPVADAKISTANSNRAPAPAKQAQPSITSDMMSNGLTARPTTSTRGNEGQVNEAPVLDPSVTAPGNSALAGISSSNAVSFPSPEMRPEGPVKIGGNVKEPKLLSSVMPVYPSTARSSGQQGDVVVDTTIDKSGRVVRMHAIAGPTSLRSAAMDALRRWRYEPSTLDGEPVEVQMQVTIKFRL